MDYLSLTALVRDAASGERAIQSAAAYRAFPLRLSFSSYCRGVEWLAARYEEMGLEAAVVPFPADGRSTYGDRHFPLAWDIEEGWLRAAAPDYPEPVLADYAEDPYGVVPFCADSGGVQEGVIVPAQVIRQRGRAEAGRRVVVLFEKYPSPTDANWAIEAGCVAAVACFTDSPRNAIELHARRWFNDLFGEGQIDHRHRTIPAFSVSPRQARMLIERHRNSGPVPVRYLVRARTFDGLAPAATACIRGTEEPEREVFVTAHGYEPNASNDASGVAACLEAARVLAEHIRSGRLPRPRRTIRFFHGLEMFGLYAYAMRNREAMRNALCGFTLDSIGMADIAGEKETFDFLHNPYVHPSWAHGLAYRMIAAAAERLKVGHAYLIGSPSNDDIIQDPLFGPAWCLLYGTIMVKSGVYHSNADTVGNLSAERMKELAALAGAFAASAADAGEDQAMTLARMASAYALTRAADRCRDAVAALPDSREALRERGLKLAAYRDMAVPAGVAAIQSAADLLPAPRRESFLSEVAPLAAAFRASAEGMVKAALGHLAALAGAPAARFVKVHPDRLEREAANAVVTRNVAGALGLGTLPPAARQEAARFAGYYSEEYWSFGGLRYFWFDGRRTVREAALAAWASSRSPHTETPGARNKALRDFVDLTAFLERHGCVRAERRPLAAPVTKDDIAAGLRRLGVESGDVVMVHSSLSQFGEVVGGPDAVIGALMDVITPRGVLAMPTFTNTAVGEADPPFDPATSVVYTGAVPEAFRSRPGVLRHGHPTHSIAAWGERAAEFLRCHDPYDTFDRRGPWGRLYDWDGKILCFGETMGANTYIHALEAWLLNYLDVAYARVLEGGVERQVRITNYPDGCRGGWYGKRRESEFFKRLNPQGVYRETRIGEAAALVARVRDFTGAMHRLFQEDPAILLHKTGCLPCAERRARLFGWAVPATTARAPRDERDQRSGIC